jgi:hypothetical protein
MSSKITKSIASRIPIELYYQLQNEARDQGLNMNDYFLKIIERRNVKSDQVPIEIPLITKLDRLAKGSKQKLLKIDSGNSAIVFPD